MGKYKKAIKAELKWLEEDIMIIDKMLTGEEDNPNNYTTQDLRTRLRYATNEISRLNSWMKEFEKG